MMLSVGSLQHDEMCHIFKSCYLIMVTEHKEENNCPIKSAVQFEKSVHLPNMGRSSKLAETK